VTGHDHWFEPIADHLGAAYLRYSFTKGTRQEVDAVVGWLGLRPGMRVLDVGCGPGRHAHELASRGIRVHGIDISQRFIDIARSSDVDGATFERLDARSLTFDAEFDAVICLCQGAFGLMTANFAVKYHDGATFDADTGVSHEVTEVKNEQGRGTEVDLWTGCYTPRELRLLMEKVGMAVDHIYSVEPGRYVADPPSVETPEFLLIASATPFRR
ncbi:MAG: hypothetical protein RL430_1425, partial [Actinomycetota bacterium]